MAFLSEETIDYLQGRSQAANQAAQQAAADATSLTATGATTQITGFDSSGKPQAKNVAGDSNGIGLAFSGNTLQATLAQDLKATASPTFVAVNVTNAPLTRSNIGAAAKASPAITGATIPLAKITGGGTDGSLTVNIEGIVTAYVAPT